MQWFMCAHKFCGNQIRTKQISQTKCTHHHHHHQQTMSNDANKQLRRYSTVTRTDCQKQNEKKNEINFHRFILTTIGICGNYTLLQESFARELFWGILWKKGNLMAELFRIFQEDSFKSWWASLWKETIKFNKKL